MLNDEIIRNITSLLFTFAWRARAKNEFQYFELKMKLTKQQINLLSSKISNQIIVPRKLSDCPNV